MDPKGEKKVWPARLTCAMWILGGGPKITGEEPLLQAGAVMIDWEGGYPSNICIMTMMHFTQM